MYAIQQQDVEGGLFINGEKCPNDALAQCSSSAGNILVSYDTSSIRVISPETISSCDNSDVIILGNGIIEKGRSWRNNKEIEFAMRGLRTPSPDEIVTQWLQDSPSCKSLEKMPTIIVERSTNDKEESTSRLTSTFEIFDLGGANRQNKTPSNQNSLRISPNATSPETRRKQELCSYLQLMNMNLKSDKQRAKFRPNFNRRSNRVKNLIVQIEKRKLEEKIDKVKLNSSENAQLIHEILYLHRKSILSSQMPMDVPKAKSLPESSDTIAILQGFTPSLLPLRIRKRKVAFDIVMRRFITDESITVKELKYNASVISFESERSGQDRPDINRKLKENYNLLKRRSSTINSEYNRVGVPVCSETKQLSDSAIIFNETNNRTESINCTLKFDVNPNVRTRSKLNISNALGGKKQICHDDITMLNRRRQKLRDTGTMPDEINLNKTTRYHGSDDEILNITRSSKLKMAKASVLSCENKSKNKEALKNEVKTSSGILKLKSIKTVKRKINDNETRVKRLRYKSSLTLFEKEIMKVARLGRLNNRSRVHNLRIKRNRFKRRANFTSKHNEAQVTRNKSFVQNVLKTKQGNENNSINNGAKINEDYKNATKLEIVKRVDTNENISSNSEIPVKTNRQLQLFTEKQVEIVNLTAISVKVNKTSGKINNFDKQTIIEPPEIEENCYCLNDHTYTRCAEEISNNAFQDNSKNIDAVNFRGFNLKEQNISNRILKLASAAYLVIENSYKVRTKQNETDKESTVNDLSNAIGENECATIKEQTNLGSNSVGATNEEGGISPLEIEENAIVERESSRELNIENASDDSNEINRNAKKDDGTLNEIIHYNMHDYYVPEKLNKISDSNDSSSSNDNSSDSSSVYSEISNKFGIENISQSLPEGISGIECVNSIETINEMQGEVRIKKKETEKPIRIIIPKVVEPFNLDKIVIQPLNFTNRNIRSVTPPTYIPFLPQKKTPSKTLHRNLTNSNNCIRRKIAILHQAQLASPSGSNGQLHGHSSQNPPSNNLSSHCATLSPTNGRLLHVEYCAGQLVASQERLVTCWAQTPLGHILHSQELWIARGVAVRQQFGENSLLKNMKNRLMIVDNVVSYVEIWIKEHKSVFRERPVADVFAVIYSWKPNQPVEKKLIQLENIKGSADDVQCIILKKSRSVLVSWSIMQSTIKQATVLHLYELSPDYQRVLTIKELKSIGTKIQSLHTIEDSDNLVIGCGENCVNIWNVEHGYIVATLDMPDTLPEPRCLWTLCNQGFVFLLQECNDGLLRLIAINGIKMKITWKNLKIFNPPKTYYNLLGVCLENGILVSCYENGMLSWNVQTSELLTDEPFPMEEMAPFSPPCCFLSDNHLIQLERNGQIYVRHILYHLLTSSDLSM